MFTKNSFNGKADPVADAIKAIAEADYALKMEALKGNQAVLDKNKNNKLDADDFKIIRGEKKKTVKEEDDKPRSAGSVFDKDVAKSFTKKKGEGTGHEAKETKTGTQYTKKAPKDSEETNESFSSFKDKLKSGAKKVARVLGGPDDEGHKKDLQRKMGAKPEQQTGKKSMAKYNEEFDLESIDPALVEEFMQTEEYNQLDELSKSTLSSYVKKRGAQLRGGYEDKDKIKGINSALRKVKQNDAMKEEVEEISELKKSTLASYVKKSSSDMKDQAISGARAYERDNKPKMVKHSEKMLKRLNGVRSAADRLAKEEVESVEETTGVTDYNPKSQGGTRSELLAKLRTSKSSEHATAARKAGATQKELQDAMKKEEVEQIDELGKGTLSRYADKAATDAVDNLSKAHEFKTISDRIKSRPPGKVGDNLIDRASKQEKKYQDKANKRTSGLIKATTRLKNEEVEQIEERKLTKAEKKKKKKLVKGMKKSLSGFKARYGSRGKEVMYATATKKAEE